MLLITNFLNLPQVNLIIPCMGISFLTILVFYLPSDSGEKVSLLVLSFITSTTNKFMEWNGISFLPKNIFLAFVIAKLSFALFLCQRKTLSRSKHFESSIYIFLATASREISPLFIAASFYSSHDEEGSTKSTMILKSFFYKIRRNVYLSRFRRFLYVSQG